MARLRTLYGGSGHVNSNRRIATVRPVAPPGSVPTPGVTTTTSPPSGSTVSAVSGSVYAASRDKTLEASDTAMGTIIPINLGAFRASFKLVHFDIQGDFVECVALIGEGPIESVDAVWIDSSPAYGWPLTVPNPNQYNTPAQHSTSWIRDVVVRLGTLDQLPPGNITNPTIAQLAWPGFAYVSIRYMMLGNAAGGIPRVEIAGKGLLGWDYANPTLPAPDLPVAWTENPIACLMALMRSPDFGCGLSKSMLDAMENTPGKSWYDCALACDNVVTRLGVEDAGSTSGTTPVGTYPRVQVFTTVNDSFVLQVKIKVLDHSLDGKGYPDLFQLQNSIYPGATTAPLLPIMLNGGLNPGWTCSLDEATLPTVPVAINGAGDYYFTAFYGNDIAQAEAGNVYAAGTKMYLLMNPVAGAQWYMNEATDDYDTQGGLYGPGNAIYMSVPAGPGYSATWTAANYQMWFRTAVAEKMFRLELTITQRQPIEQVVTPILQICNGRWGWWDGLYRVSLDHMASGSLLLSDQEFDNPDIPIVQDTLQCTRSSPDTPNVAIGDYYDTTTWDKREVWVPWLSVIEGLAQFRELRFSSMAVPSGDQAFRLLTTWLNRGQRTWHAQCSVPQHGIRLHPGMLVQLKSRMFSSTKTMIVDTVDDNSAGTFDITMLEYNAADFCMAGYASQGVIDTATQMPDTDTLG